MLEKLQPYLFSVCIFFGFLCFSIIFERYRRYIVNLPWKKIITIFCVWIGILLLRKLTYYIPLYGVLQTKDSIWCIKTKTLSFFGVSLLFLTFLLFLISYLINICEGCGCVVFWIFCITLISCWALPLIIIKMLTTGKYIGLFTSFLIIPSSLFFLKIFKEIGKNKLYLIIILILWICAFKFNKFTIGNPEKIILNELINVNQSYNENQWNDLFDAVKNFVDKTSESKLNGIKTICPAFATIQNINPEKANKFINILLNSTDNLNLLSYTDDLNEKIDAYIEIIRTILKNGNINSTYEIFNKTINIAKNFNDYNDKSSALKKIAVAVSINSNIEWTNKIFDKLIEATADSEVYNDNIRAVTLAEIAKSIAKTGDTEWALEVAKSIPDFDYRKKMIDEIEEIKK